MTITDPLDVYDSAITWNEIFLNFTRFKVYYPNILGPEKLDTGV